MGPFSLLLLDRDGVINEDMPLGVRHQREFVLLPQVPQAIARVNQKGIPVAVVTNQANIGRGFLSHHDLEAIHYSLQERLKSAHAKIDHFFICPDAMPTARRKPAPGMLLEACQFFEISPPKTLMVGDALTDLEAAAAAGCPSVLLKTGKGGETLRRGFLKAVAPWKIFENLCEMIDFLCKEDLLSPPVSP